ncbi:cytochrome P450 [Westerdykella ornata]|uniref:Cytochrome P450 n=1 Tax=Westerdykella ornata TaxID=318751 RepID=A0A6A6JPB0_WESOR|nr:cytochrome P450 [Westerdykella ornata]KAF2278104.1 cytochrome P450 [Westerdykella ornata]
MDLWPVAPPQIIITDPDLALHITVANNLPKHEFETKFAGPVVGKGSILLEEGASWKQLHRMLAPAFNATNVRNRTSMVADEVMIFRSILHKYADSGEPFSLEQAISKLTFDLIFTTTFGFSQHAQQKGSAILDLFKKLLDQNYIIQESLNPIKRRLARWRCAAASRELDGLIEPLVKERYALVREKNLDVSQRVGLSIIDLVIREYLQEEAGRTDNKGDAKSDSPSSSPSPAFLATAIAQIKTLLLAGTGTATDTLCFAYMLLSKEPGIISRLIDEHSRAFAPSIDETVSLLHSSPGRLADLELTTNVLKETLRLYPIGHTVRAADAIEYKGRVYPAKGHLIFPLSHTMHYDPSVFPNPSRFDPDRFTPSSSSSSSSSPSSSTSSYPDGLTHPRHAWRPFERGPRACLGQTMAMEEMKVVLLLTVREFEFEVLPCEGEGEKEKGKPRQRVPWTDLDTRFGDVAFQEMVFEARPRGGMRVRVRRSGKERGGGKV